jgi:polysaccharide export outer membrane protein
MRLEMKYVLLILAGFLTTGTINSAGQKTVVSTTKAESLAAPAPADTVPALHEGPRRYPLPPGDNINAGLALPPESNQAVAQRQYGYVTQNTISALSAASTTNDPVLQDRHPRYVVQREDVLSFTFPLSPELNQTLTVQPDGYISLQNAGSLYAQGLTAPELVLAVKRAYVGILHDPIVDLDIQDFQKPFFTVSGQVGKPGQYELRADLTITEALAVAGGMTMASAKTQIFVFHRTSQNWLEVKAVNLKDILRGKNINEDVMIRPGDMVYVPENFITKFRKYVPYSVNPGLFLQTPTL